MSTEISPRATLRFAPATPTMTPNFVWMSVPRAAGVQCGERLPDGGASRAPD